MAHVTSLIWFIIYVVVFIPAAAMIRMVAKDPLQMRCNGTHQSYWIDRQGSQYSAMKRAS